MHLVAVWAGCRKVSTGRSFVVQTSIESASMPLYGFIGDTVCTIQSGGVFAGWRALAIERLLMSVCGECCETWFTFLAPSRSGNMDD